MAGLPLVGDEFAGYRVRSVLGRRGMSVVYLAEDLRLRRKVALKLLAPRLTEDAAFRQRVGAGRRLGLSTRRQGLDRAIVRAGKRHGAVDAAAVGENRHEPRGEKLRTSSVHQERGDVLQEFFDPVLSRPEPGPHRAHS